MKIRYWLKIIWTLDTLSGIWNRKSLFQLKCILDVSWLFTSQAVRIRVTMLPIAFAEVLNVRPFLPAKKTRLSRQSCWVQTRRYRPHSLISEKLKPDNKTLDHGSWITVIEVERHEHQLGTSWSHPGLILHVPIQAHKLTSKSLQHLPIAFVYI